MKEKKSMQRLEKRQSRAEDRNRLHPASRAAKKQCRQIQVQSIEQNLPDQSVISNLVRKYLKNS